MEEVSRLRHIAVLRTDRLGDVLMTLPALDLLRRSAPRTTITFFVRPELVDVLTPFFRSRQILPAPLPETKLAAWSRTFSEGSFDGGLFLFQPAEAILAAWRDGLPLRVGNYSKPLSFLCFNGGLRQKRSTQEANEAAYNCALARSFLTKAGLKTNSDLPPIELAGDDRSVDKAKAALADLGLGDSAFLLCHPGMGGSALNLSPASYRDLLTSLVSRRQLPLVLSCGPAPRDRCLVDELCRLLPQAQVLRGVELSTLREVFRRAQLVVAPSTGPLHLAHFVGTETLGLYSPVRSQRPTRWAPWGGAGRSKIVVPDVPCPGIRHCLGSACPYFPCMDRNVEAHLPLLPLGGLNWTSGKPT